MRMYKRNTRLYTPRDFDYSPYFQIIKYPLLGLNDLSVYRQLPWDQDGVICNDENECFLPIPESTSSEFATSPPEEKKNSEYSQAYSDTDTEDGTTLTDRQSKQVN